MSKTKFAALSLLLMFSGLMVLQTPDAQANDDPSRFRLKGRFSTTPQFFNRANSTYRERMKNGSLERKFKVQIRNGTPGDTMNFCVTHAGASHDAGSAMFNGFGIIRFQLRTPQHIDSPNDGDPMPADFPFLAAGDVVAAVDSLDSSVILMATLDLD